MMKRRVAPKKKRKVERPVWPPATGSFATMTVHGDPAPQGSKRALRSKHAKGRIQLVESSKKVKPWREAVDAEARRLARIAGCFDGPLAVRFEFHLAPPQRTKKGALPFRKPDLSKLIRSTEDALTTAGLIADDARIVRLRAEKVYVAADGLLDRPGVIIEVWKVASDPRRQE
jgi:Holliday junction resolvase RusA-like endonuclease